MGRGCWWIVWLCIAGWNWLKGKPSWKRTKNSISHCISPIEFPRTIAKKHRGPAHNPSKSFLCSPIGKKWTVAVRLECLSRLRFYDSILFNRRFCVLGSIALAGKPNLNWGNLYYISQFPNWGNRNFLIEGISVKARRRADSVVYYSVRMPVARSIHL